MIELSELAQDSGGLVAVLRHGTGQSLSSSRADSLLMVGDISDEQRAELGDQLQTQGLPQPGDTGERRDTYAQSLQQGQILHPPSQAFVK